MKGLLRAFVEGMRESDRQSCTPTRSRASIVPPQNVVCEFPNTFWDSEPLVSSSRVPHPALRLKKRWAKLRSLYVLLTESLYASRFLKNGVAVCQDCVILFLNCIKGAPQLSVRGWPSVLGMGGGYRMQGHQGIKDSLWGLNIEIWDSRSICKSPATWSNDNLAYLVCLQSPLPLTAIIYEWVYMSQRRKGSQSEFQ